VDQHLSRRTRLRNLCGKADFITIVFSCTFSITRRHNSARAAYPQILSLDDKLPEMKPIRNTLVARLGLLRLYREDMDQLVQLFRDSCENFIIANEQNSFEDLDDMKKNIGPKITSFFISSENPGIVFEFNRSEVISKSNTPVATMFNELRTTEISDAADSLFYKIKDFLRSHEQRKVRPGSLVCAAGALVAVVYVPLHYTVVDSNGHQGLTPRGLLGFLFCLLIFGAFFGAGLHVGNFMTLERRRDSPSFFVRNREDFAKHGVTAAIGSIIGGLVGYCIGHFLK
jgi:hypothetical protein